MLMLIFVMVVTILFVWQAGRTIDINLSLNKIRTAKQFFLTERSQIFAIIETDAANMRGLHVSPDKLTYTVGNIAKTFELYDGYLIQTSGDIVREYRNINYIDFRLPEQMCYNEKSIGIICEPVTNLLQVTIANEYNEEEAIKFSTQRWFYIENTP